MREGESLVGGLYRLTKNQQDRRFDAHPRLLNRIVSSLCSQQGLTHTAFLHSQFRKGAQSHSEQMFALRRQLFYFILHYFYQKAGVPATRQTKGNHMSASRNTNTSIKDYQDKLLCKICFLSDAARLLYSLSS